MTRLHLDFFLLGTPVLRLDGKLFSPARRKSAALLYYLACRGQALGRSAAAGLLWPEFPPDRARQSLREALFETKREAGRSLVESREGFLRFSEELEIGLDVLMFSSLADRGIVLSSAALAAEEPAPEAFEEARALLLEAEPLYRGEFLEGFFLGDAVGFENWQLAESERLTSLAASVETALARLALRVGDHREAELRARKAIEVAPLYELGHLVLVEALAAAGDAGSAQVHARSYGAMLMQERERRPGAAFLALLARVEREESSRPASFAVSGDRHPYCAVQPARRIPSSPTSFIGRERELAQIMAALRPGRILTLLGTGGIGKTRLALEVARRSVASYRSGIVFVDLASCASDDGVAQLVASSMGLRVGFGGAASLPTLLAWCRLLLILDNCEHVIEGVAELASLIAAACPEVAILVTCRERLGLSGEGLYEVPTLDLQAPGGEGGRPRADFESEASLLLLERARSASPDFSPAPEELEDIVAICGRLDGLPLALELASTRLAALGPGVLRRFLESSLTAAIDILDGESRDPRGCHRSLRALFDHSWDTLGAAEKAAFARLSVFQGGFSPTAALFVCGEGSEAALSCLVGKSLVVGQRQGGEGRRYRLLSTVRGYAAVRLRESGDAEAARRSHVAFYSALASRLEGEAGRQVSIPSIRRASLDLDEFEAAMRYALGFPDLQGVAASMVRSLVGLFWMRGEMNRLVPVLDALTRRDLEPAALANHAWAEGHRRLWNLEGPAALEALDRAAERFSEGGDVVMRGYALSMADRAAECFEDWQDPEPPRSEHARAIFESIGSSHGIATACYSRASSLFAMGRPLCEAERRLADGLPHARASGDLVLLAEYHRLLAQFAVRRHADEGAMEYIARSLPLFEGIDDPAALGDLHQLRATLLYRARDDRAGLECALRCLVYRRRVGRSRPIAMALRFVADGLLRLGRRDEGLSLAREAVGMASSAGSHEEALLHGYTLAFLELDSGREGEAREIALDRCVAERARAGSPLLALALTQFGLFCLQAGDHAEAASAFREALTLLEGRPRSAGSVLVLLGMIEPECIEVGEARTLLGASLAAFDPHAACVALALGLRLVEEGRSGEGLAAAARGIAAIRTEPMILARSPTAAVAQRATQLLRGSLGARAVDPVIAAAESRYGVRPGSFYSELVGLLPGIEAACAAAGRLAPDQLRSPGEG